MAAVRAADEYNLPLYLAFADPMNTPGLLLSPEMRQGFTFTIMDVEDTEADRLIELRAPEQLYDIAILLRDPERYVIESLRSNASGEVAAAVSTTRLHNIAGKYKGKDDPVMLVRVQQRFPATGEVLAPFAIGHFVAGGMRGSHNMPLLEERPVSKILVVYFSRTGCTETVARRVAERCGAEIEAIRRGIRRYEPARTRSPAAVASPVQASSRSRRTSSSVTWSNRSY